VGKYSGWRGEKFNISVNEEEKKAQWKDIYRDNRVVPRKKLEKLDDEGDLSDDIKK
jgi:hypothetical protein